MRKFFIFLTLLSISSNLLSQKEWSNWYYWSNNLLTFKNGSPELVHNFIQPQPIQYDIYNYYYWGVFPLSVSYSDPATGNMRFLICANMAFGSDFKAFPKIRTQFLRGCSDDQNAYHIIPFHNNPDKFYVIQFQDCVGDLLSQQTGLQVKCPNAIGLGYSIVDMTLNGGFGDFTIFNQQIASSQTQQMTTVRHSNGKDVWVITHPANSNSFSAYLVTDNGIAAPINSTIGPMVTGSYQNHAGKLTASRNGKLLAGYSAVGSGVQLFDFDNSTGTLSNYRTIPYKGYVVSMQFSPDDSKLYYCGYNDLYQYDLNQTDIGASLTKIYTTSGGSMFAMQLAIDGKIYVNGISENIGNTSQQYTGAIQCPDLPQYACNFNPHALPEGGMDFMTLINDVAVDPKAAPVTKFSIGNDTSICSGTLTIKAPAGWQSYKWNTGETSQSITVTKPGVYYVLTGNTGFNCPSGYGYTTISDKTSSLNLGQDTTICSGANFKLHVDDNFSNIAWENGNNNRDSIITSPGLYKITALGKDGCPSKDSINVTFNIDTKAQFGNDTSLCQGSSLILNLYPSSVTSNAIYKWQDGSSNDNFTITKTGTYWGSVEYAGCKVSDTIHVQFQTAGNAGLGKDTTVCAGDSIALRTPIANASYIWSNGETSQQIVVKTAGNYFIKVNNGSCDFYDTVLVKTANRPLISLGNDTTICSTSILRLAPSTGPGNYLWQDGSGKSFLNVIAEGTYWLQYTENGCSVRDSITVGVKQSPKIFIGNDTTLCENTILVLNANTSVAASYKWQDGSKSPRYTVKQAGKYFVEVVGANDCNASDSITITFVNLPKAIIQGDSVICNNQPVLLHSFTTNANSIMWQDGSNTSQITVSQPGQYLLKATNSCGTVTTEKKVSKGLCTLILPNAFSPNSDNNNDVFRVKYPFENRQFVMRIYNRWGEKIFESNNIKQGWDGMFKGHPQPIGLYIWYVSATDENNNTQNQHGTVLLLR